MTGALVIARCLLALGLQRPSGGGEEDQQAGKPLESCTELQSICRKGHSRGTMVGHPLGSCLAAPPKWLQLQPFSGMEAAIPPSTRVEARISAYI